MNTQAYQETSLTSTRDLTKIGLVAALYVAVTLILSVISFGAIQLRLSEMFNYLALFHKRYIVAITLGVVIVNFMSPMWFLDVPVGGIATFLVLILSRALTKNMKNLKAKLATTAIVFALSMFTVAGHCILFLIYRFG
ncbi:QueT transporter family protein [Oceanobacillus sp. Castelsardo]|uniref:QueT transporter family protein n=1 Tax=Oceanobacillus sp. Castelsardo TaxID=1851204 RepID=UPI000ABF84FD|nr:QueT transporter family protein [Oceanobacillus sp. Castelsardo]